jgi:hypothetical protein
MMSDKLMRFFAELPQHFDEIGQENHKQSSIVLDGSFSLFSGTIR